ncbi:hypothetical protein J3D55_002436 [Chryseobacterium ginsenosidimutans]|nr:hypothetical protein [Chryseobacterium ginsenosidimutans]
MLTRPGPIDFDFFYITCNLSLLKLGFLAIRFGLALIWSTIYQIYDTDKFLAKHALNRKNQISNCLKNCLLMFTILLQLLLHKGVIGITSRVTSAEQRMVI